MPLAFSLKYLILGFFAHKIKAMHFKQRNKIKERILQMK